MLAASTPDWPVVILFASLAVASAMVALYGRSLGRMARLGQRSLYKNPDTVGNGLLAIGSIAALAFALGAIFLLVRPV